MELLADEEAASDEKRILDDGEKLEGSGDDFDS